MATKTGNLRDYLEANFLIKEADGTSPPTIAVFGSLNIDFITRTSRVPLGGETLEAQSFDTGCGGKGANQAVACARLSRYGKGNRRDQRQGAVESIDMSEHDAKRSKLDHASQDGSGVWVNIEMYGAVGDDTFGKDLKRTLTENAINVDNVMVRSDQKTGIANIIVEEETGENRILLSPNANHSLKENALLDAISKENSPNRPGLIIMQLEIPLSAVIGVLTSSVAEHTPILLNPAPARSIPPQALKHVEHLIVNESEAAIMIGRQGQEESLSWTTAGGLHTDELLALGPKHLVVTLGSKGVFYLDSVSGKIAVIPAERVKVKDTTAAGDTFVGAYATAVALNDARSRHCSFDDIVDIIKMANKAAAITVQKAGAQDAIPWLDEL